MAFGLGAGTVVAMAAPPASAAAGCARADLLPTSGNRAQVRHATLCLINQERRSRRLRKLRVRRSLERVAQQHTSDMVSRRYFSHLTPAGLTVTARIRRTVYASRRTHLLAGENIAWGQGGMATPRSVVRNWMSSAAHRANILSRAYRHIGVGVIPGSPATVAGGATFTVVFAVKT